MKIKVSGILRGVALLAILSVPLGLAGCAGFSHEHHEVDSFITEVRNENCDKECYSHVPPKSCCRYTNLHLEKKCENPETCALKCCYLKAESPSQKAADKAACKPGCQKECCAGEPKTT